MNKRSILKLAGVGILVLMVSLARASAGPVNTLPKNIEQFVKWQTEANGVSLRSPVPIALEHFEIPLSSIEARIAENFEKDVHESLVFVKDGKKYVRWMINPEDTEVVVLMEKKLRDAGFDSARYHHFTAYQTASRSMIIQDPATGAVFSAKVGTNRTGGNWQNKKLTALQAKQSFETTKEIETAQKTMRFRRQNFLPERATFAFADQGFVIRSLEIFLQHPERNYLPAFSAVHEVEGKRIAALNGSDDPARFWMENGIVRVAKADAEFIALTGRVPEAYHWQNYLFELDADFKVTGQIIRIDFQDSNLVQPIFKGLKNHETLEWWPKNHIVTDFQVGMGALHGNTVPTWIPTTSESNGSRIGTADWRKSYFTSFDNELGEITGMGAEKARESIKPYSFNGHSQFTSYLFNHAKADWEKYVEVIECFRGSKQTLAGNPCPPEISSRTVPYRLCAGHLFAQ